MNYVLSHSERVCMNRLLWGIVVSLAVGVHTATGQPSDAVHPSGGVHHYGIKGGAVVSGFDGKDYQRFLGYEVNWIQDDAGSPDLGFQIGFFYTRPLSKHFAVQPELYFVRRGFHFYETKQYNTSYRLKVYYLQLPVLLKYRIFLAGPYAAVKLGAYRTLDVWGDRDTQRVACVRRFDYGLIFAVSPSFPAWSGRLIFDVRFEYGLAHSMTPPEGHTPLSVYQDSGKVQVLAFTFMTGFRF